MRFYLYALGLPVLLFAVMNVELALLGEDVELARLGDVVPAYVATFVVVTLAGGGKEEPGWRGFALDRFQARHSPVVATLLLGVVWGRLAPAVPRAGIRRSNHVRLLLHLALQPHGQHLALCTPARRAHSLSSSAPGWAAARMRRRSRQLSLDIQ